MWDPFNHRRTGQLGVAQAVGKAMAATISCSCNHLTPTYGTLANQADVDSYAL